MSSMVVPPVSDPEPFDFLEFCERAKGAQATAAKLIEQIADLNACGAKELFSQPLSDQYAQAAHSMLSAVNGQLAIFRIVADQINGVGDDFTKGI